MTNPLPTLLLLLLLLLLPALAAVAQTTDPTLRLNTDMHTADIKRISTDAAGKYILTASQDKTAKRWDAATGELLQTFRPPIGEGNEGMLYAGAIHPDGGQVALGGWSEGYPRNKTMDIFIFDTRSGALLHRISGLPNVIQGLEYAPSGNYLVATLGGSNGIRIYRSATYGLYQSDSDYGADSYNAAFDASGRMATTCFDGYVRLYDAGFRLLQKTKPLAGKRPFSLAFSPDGAALAVGFSDDPAVLVLDGKTLGLLYKPDISGATDVAEGYKVCFTQDGSHLVAGGFYRKSSSGKWWHQLRVWDKAGRGSYTDYDGGLNSITDIQPLPDGSVAYCSAAPDWGILHPATGRRRLFKASELNAYTATDKSHLQTNADGYLLGITPLGENALSFDLNRRGIVEKAAALPAYTEQLGGLRLSDWKNSTSPRLNGKALSFLKQYEKSYSVDIAPGGGSFVVGASYSLYCLDAQGKQLWEMPTQAYAWCVKISGDGRVVLAGCSDGTVRWYRLSDGKLLLTLYLHPDRQRWAIWSPSGYYDAAPGAEDLIGWHVNRSEDEAALYYPVSKFRSQYYRPDVIDRMVETLDEAEALRQANEVAGRFGNAGSRPRNLADEAPPSIKILSPATGSAVSSSELKIEYSIQSPGGEAVTGIKAYVDGRPVSGLRGLKPTGLRGSLSVPIPAADCRVSLIAENRFGASEQASIHLTWAGRSSPTPAAGPYKPTLYVLAIGVSEYQTKELKLDYAAKDALDFEKAVSRQQGLLYQSVQVKTLTDANATRPNILDGLEWIVKQTTQHDVAMIFFAGHGRETSRGTFYYVPVEADLSDASLRQHGIMREDIKETVATVVGKVVVFMDACHSGNLMESSRRRGNPDLTRIINELTDAENGAIVFSSSSGRQFSVEDAKWQNGAFTKALVEGLNGAAANSDGSITWKSLDSYVTRRVKELTGGEQSAVTAVPPDTQDYPIGVK